MSSDPITPDSQSLEASLRELQPSVLDEAFLSRLESAAEDRLTELSPAEIRFEKSLQENSPASLSPAFLDSLENVMSGIPFPLDEKIVLFPKAAPELAKPTKTGQRSLFAAAAAVALIGAATALLMPQKPSAAGSGLANTSNSPVIAPENIAPVTYDRGLSEAKDEGVIWQSKDKPQRVVRVVYMDRITTKNAEGKTVEIEQPRVEYILVPEKID
jgi:hypothetical protein